ncbi:MAG: Hpt domain-containing protein [Pseudolabrys sp.]|jgi:HPt (histidine-containing phosphotransfer) domain-containing protein|nr:Hpt domain-containing protein [Pseudolabrys sp.]
MAQEAIQVVEKAPATPSVTASIDQIHLSRTTLGDHSLEHELLQLFSRQTTLIMARMRPASPAIALSLAHTLKNSAQCIGAWRVVRAAEAVELADGTIDEVEFAKNRLAAAVEEAQSTIFKLLRAH